MGCGRLVHWKWLAGKAFYFLSFVPAVTCTFSLQSADDRMLGQGLLCPVMFAALHEKTLYIFGACCAISIPMVWALYPETNQRTLEEMDLVFASDSIWNWEAEKNFKLLKEQNPQLVQAAQRGKSVVDPETGLRRGSVPAGFSLETNNEKSTGYSEHK